MQRIWHGPCRSMAPKTADHTAFLTRKPEFGGAIGRG
jgi:hypothetical protein